MISFYSGPGNFIRIYIHKYIAGQRVEFSPVTALVTALVTGKFMDMSVGGRRLIRRLDTCVYAYIC